ncbi:P-type ATPase P5 type [Schizosaccharomyces octosporus yFS286]|uniref:Cation-transporting ATPase n=1 Tax=Schizosaccharomyces octosporus (strain yFS286) TaxID=483514 RepID=S9R0B5_SCHOY|nr:P-type ATPase P5 type [Schizosaccharomyces octosporus yFS286]EPX71920.1 P-type ATPase P5 type [Schizosaccharomyces octosporus yFS286]
MTSPRSIRGKNSVTSLGSKKSLNTYLASSLMSHDSIFDGPGLGTSIPSSISSFHHKTQRGSSDASVSQFSMDYLQSEYNLSRYNDTESIAAASSVDYPNIYRDNGSAVYSDEEEITEMMLEEHNFHPILRRESPGEAAGISEDGCCQILYLVEEDLEVGIAGYRTNKLRARIYNLICILTFGLVYLIMRWLPRHYIRFIGKREPLATAEWLSIETQYGEISKSDIQVQPYENSLSTIFGASIRVATSEGTDNDPFVENFRYVNYRYMKLIFHPILERFLIQQDWKDPRWIRDTNVVKEGLERDAINDRTKIFGQNIIDLETKGVIQLLVDEVLHPFYIFQVFSIILWSLDAYYYYAICIFLISVVSIIGSLIETRTTLKRMREMSRFTCPVRVYRDGFWASIPSSDLVVGDVFEISDPELTVFPADALLLSGDCIVNESMLTGESIPVSKIPATNQGMKDLFAFSRIIPPSLSKHFLFGGTKIIQVRKPFVNEKEEGASLAMVIRTGFNTTKGALVRSMIFPKPTNFGFYRDSFRFITAMFIIAVIGFVFSSINLLTIGVPAKTIIIRALDLITIVVPPALPATLTIGTTFAISRLRKQGIFCISPQRVNVSGKLDLISFDKTGTLTEDGLDIMGVSVIEDSKLTDLRNNPSTLCSKDLLSNDSPSNLLFTMATCHMLRRVEGELLGDPLDMKMFEFTDWTYSEENFTNKLTSSEQSEDAAYMRTQQLIPPTVSPPWNDPSINYSESDLELGIIRTFEFVSQLRRMAVIVKHGQYKKMDIYVKGAPEVMPSICKPESFPENYQEVLDYYTHNGFRVIACASKHLENCTWAKAQRMKRTQVESDLDFCGLIVFENKLKSSTIPVINELEDSKIRTVMCTGDNVLTSICVGKRCGMLPQDGLVFVPRFEEEELIGDIASRKLIWQSIEDNDVYLDPQTLHPVVDSASRNLLSSEFKRFKSYHMAITGDVFRWLVDYAPVELFNAILLKTQIFARMSPSEKNELVSCFQKLDYCVGFCGDGANDCGALKAADVGISLSEAEASVAAPFTSRWFEISCVLDVIKDGRAALVTSFGCFQYMALYSAIQFVTVSMLYTTNSNLGDFQFLFIDLAIILPIAVFMGRSKPFHRLAQKRPTANLVSKRILSPLLGQIFFICTFQYIILRLVRQQPWYIPPPAAGSEKSSIANSDVTSLFLFSVFQYILIGLVLTVGPPYRQRMWRNVSFTVSICALLGIAVSLTKLHDRNNYFMKVFRLTPMSDNFQNFIIFCALIYYVCAASGQQYIFTGLVNTISRLYRRLQNKRKVSKKLYKRLSAKLHNEQV